MSNKIYLLSKYHFYDGEEVIMVSYSYNKLKKLFDNLILNSKTGKGYIIYEFELDKEYNHNLDRPKTLDWVQVEYNGDFKNIKEL